MKTEKRERYKYQMHLLLRLVKIYHALRLSFGGA